MKLERSAERISLTEHNHPFPTSVIDSFRFKLLHWFTCPLPFLPRAFPILGGKSFFELFIALFFLILFLAIGFSNSLSAGNINNFVGLFLVSFSIRNNIIANWIGLTFEHAIFWHKACGGLMIILLLIHSIGQEQLSTTGVMLAVIIGSMASLYIVSWYGNFNLFYFGHITLYVILIIPAFLHGATALGASFFLWLIDIMVRYAFTKKTVEAELSVLSYNVLKVSLPTKSFKYANGQYCFLRVRAVNGYEFHPFSISSDPNEEKITFHVRKVGDWTRQVYDLAKTKTTSGLTVEGDISATKCFITLVDVEGPYGSLSYDFWNVERYEIIVLIAGGIGITPCLSLWKYYLQSERKPKKIVFIWLEKKLHSAEAIYKDQFEDRIHENEVIKAGIGKEITITNDSIFDYHFYLTREPPVDVEEELNHENVRKIHPWNYGRINLKVFFQKLAQYAVRSLKSSSSGKPCIGVVVCGPFPLVTSVHESCDACRKDINSDIHEEFFSL